VAGFRGPLFLLGLSAQDEEQAGFRNPLPVPPLSGGDVVQGGFRNPLPIPPMSGGAEVQAGFIGPLPILNLSGGVVEEQPDDVGYGGGGISGKQRRLLKQIEQEDEIIVAFVSAFLQVGK